MDKKGYLLIIVVTKRYIKLTRTIRIRKIATLQVAMVLLEDRIIPCIITNVILVDNGKRYTLSDFAVLLACFGTKLVTTA